jgi:cell division septum initiation protein DivIVA
VGALAPQHRENLRRAIAAYEDLRLLLRGGAPTRQAAQRALDRLGAAIAQLKKGVFDGLAAQADGATTTEQTPPPLPSTGATGCGNAPACCENPPETAAAATSDEERPRRRRRRPNRSARLALQRARAGEARENDAQARPGASSSSSSRDAVVVALENAALADSENEAIHAVGCAEALVRTLTVPITSARFGAIVARWRRLDSFFAHRRWHAAAESLSDLTQALGQATDSGR